MPCEAGRDLALRCGALLRSRPRLRLPGPPHRLNRLSVCCSSPGAQGQGTGACNPGRSIFDLELSAITSSPKAGVRWRYRPIPAGHVGRKRTFTRARRTSLASSTAADQSTVSSAGTAPLVSCPRSISPDPRSCACLPRRGIGIDARRRSRERATVGR
jgi:hypothetical protein